MFNVCRLNRIPRSVVAVVTGTASVCSNADGFSNALAPIGTDGTAWTLEGYLTLQTTLNPTEISYNRYKY